MAYQPIEQLNKNFQAKNPQYFTKPTQTASSVTSYNPMGTTAKSPAVGTTPKPNTIAPSQANTTPPEKGIATPPAQSPANSTFPGIVGSLVQTASQGSPEVQKAIEDIKNYNLKYNQENANRGTLSNPFGYVGSLDSLAANRAVQDRNVLQQTLTNALTAQGQQISGLGSAGNLASPQQVSPGNFYVNPQTGQDVSGGTITPGSGGARMAMVGQGQTAQNNVPVINSAARFTNEVNRILQQGGFNSSDLNVVNLFRNIANSNTSNPLYPQLQSNFNNAINFYAQVLGQDPNALISTLASTGKGTSLSEALRSLDTQARSYNQNLFSASQGGNVNTQVNPIPQNQSNGSTYNGIQLPN